MWQNHDLPALKRHIFHDIYNLTHMVGFTNGNIFSL